MQLGITFQPSCESLKVQSAQSVQPGGVFLGVDPNSLNLLMVSANLNQALPVDPQTVLGGPASQVLAPEGIAELIRFRDESRRLEILPKVLLKLELAGLPPEKAGRTCLLYFADGLICVEFQLETVPVAGAGLSEVGFQAILQEIQGFLGDERALAKKLCQHFRQITGFERVYFCEFAEDGHGYVPADDAIEPYPSLQDHHFPASDVPKVVRQLYLKNRYRLIPESIYEPVPILGASGSLDLTHSILRSIGETHLKYLQNMGVRASASFSVVEGESLRGLVGCHSSVPRVIPLELFPKLSQIVEAFASKLISGRLSKWRAQGQETGLSLLTFASAYEAAGCKSARVPREALASIREAFGATAVVCRSDDLFQSDPTLPEAAIRRLISTVEKHLKGSDIFVTDYLTEVDPEFASWSKVAAGMILVTLDPSQSSFIALLKPEALYSVKWGGNPSSTTVTSAGQIGPRNSFSTWVEQIRNRSRPWTPGQVELAKEFRLKLLAIRSGYLKQMEKSNQELARKNQENEVLLGEVHHRVKNNLAIVSSLFDWKMKETKDPELLRSFREMKGRIRAIASLHQTLYQGNSFGLLDVGRYLKSISTEALALLPREGCEVSVETEVPAGVSVAVSEGLPIGLIVHEFIANSLKHAFSGRERGRIRVIWREEGKRSVLRLEDDGVGCAEIDKVEGSSLGLQLMRLLSGQLDAEAAWSGTQGVSLELRLPERKTS